MNYYQSGYKPTRASSHGSTAASQSGGGGWSEQHQLAEQGRAVRESSGSAYSVGTAEIRKKSVGRSSRRDSGEITGPTTYIDSHTAIPEDLYRRLENDASMDRGVHIPKKKLNGDCVLMHTGVY